MRVFSCRRFGSIPLSSLVHVDKMLEESPKTIKTTWLRHHREKDSIASVMDADAYYKLVERTDESPLFVFPTPHEGGFRSIFFQSLNKNKAHLYTELESYKQLGQNAPACLTCTFFTELEEKKGLVLMSGKVNTDVISPTDAAFLANQTTIWYFDEDRYKNFVWKFNHKPQEYDFDKALDQMNTL